MKKLITTAAALCFSVSMLAAQSSTTPSSSTSTRTEDTKNTPQSTKTPSTSTTDATDNTASHGKHKSGAAASDMSGKDTKLQGCLSQKDGKYFVQTGAGKAVELQSSEDLGAHIGHKVRVIGSWAASSSSASSLGNETSSASATTPSSTPASSADMSGAN